MCLGIPGQIVEIGDVTVAPVAKVMVSGAKRTVDLSLVLEDGVAQDDWVLVHAGFALSKLDEQEARELLAVLQEMSEAYATETGPEPAGSPAPR